MPHHIAYLIGRERIAELEHAAGQQRRRGRPTPSDLDRPTTG